MNDTRPPAVRIYSRPTLRKDVVCAAPGPGLKSATGERHADPELSIHNGRRSAARMTAPATAQAAHLIRQVADRDREAFGRLYDAFSSLVFTLAMRMLKSRPDAEDLLQEVFAQVWRQAESYSPERGSPEAWLVNITRSRAIDKLRSVRRMEKNIVLTDDPGRLESGADVESTAAGNEAKLIVNSALAGLAEPQRKVLELAYFEGLTQTEIAARLGEPLGTVKTRIRAAIQRLRELLGTQAA
jgi:RNA polymerase sigma-70 factor (ECF subfamily)